MKTTILLIALTVSGLIEAQGHPKWAFFILFVACVEFWYESSSVRRYKRRVKERREIREYLAEQRVSKEFWQAIVTVLFAPSSRRARGVYVIVFVSLLFGQNYVWNLMGWNPISYVERVSSEMAMPEHLASTGDGIQLMSYYGVMMAMLISILVLPVAGLASVFIANQMRHGLAEHPPAEPSA